MTGLDPQRPHDPPFVPWTFEEHDEAVRELIHFAWDYADKMGFNMGVGVLDFADGTCVVLTKTIPAGEMIRVDRKAENHILAGFGTNPFANMEKLPDFTENLVEIPNPDAPKKFGVNGTKT
jgi:hypothetical protein